MPICNYFTLGKEREWEVGIGIQVHIFSLLIAPKTFSVSSIDIRLPIDTSCDV